MTRQRKYYWWCDSYGRSELKIHIDDCHIGYHSGDCGDDIESLMNKPYLKKQLNKLDLTIVESYLRELGLSDEDNLNSPQALKRSLLWIACGDIIEDEERYCA